MGENKEKETEANAPPLPDKTQMEQNGGFFPPPYPIGEKAKLEVDPELYGYWSTDTQQEGGEMEKKKKCGEGCEEEGEDDGIKTKKKRKNGCCILTIVALVLLLVLAYQAGKKAGMWHRHGDRGRDGRGCGFMRGGDDDDHHRNHHRHNHHDNDDDDRRGWSRGGGGKSCNYRQRGQTEYNHGEVCVNNEPVHAVEWDRNVEGERGSRWIQLVHDDHGDLSGTQILDYFDENEEHVCMVMDGFFSELGEVLDHFDQFSNDVIERFPFLNSTVEFVADQVRKIPLVSEELHGDERREALRQTEGYCYDDSKVYRLFRDATIAHEECQSEHEEEFMMPIDYHSSSSSSSSNSDMNMGLYTFCIYELIAN